MLIKFRGLMANRRKINKNIEFCLLVAHSLVMEMTLSMCAFGKSYKIKLYINQKGSMNPEIFRGD